MAEDDDIAGGFWENDTGFLTGAGSGSGLGRYCSSTSPRRFPSLLK